MTDPQLAKLRDYADGLRGLSDAEVHPIGLVLIDEADRHEVLQYFRDQQAHIAEVSPAVHPDFALSKLLRGLVRDALVILNVIQLDPKVMNQLSNLTHGSLSVMIAGREEPVILNPVPENATVICVMTKSDYEQAETQDVFSSTCQL